MLTMIAVCNLKSKTGTAKVKANNNLKIKVDAVDSQTCFSECLLAYSIEKCIPKASDKESAIAIVRIPPRTTSLEDVAELRPTIRPNVVITPDARPKLKPLFTECFMIC